LRNGVLLKLTSFSGSPRLTKGAIISLDIFSPTPQVITFQYNPETLTRTLEVQKGSSSGDPSESLRMKGPPVETISLDIELDATDGLEHPDQNQITANMGIYPQLAALEIILYPKTSEVVANTLIAAAGGMEIVAPEGPLTLFIWGSKRIVPIKLTDFRVVEEAHDTNLNPIRAKLSLTMRVLTYSDLKVTNPGYAIYLAHQTIKETMAGLGSSNA
jgi:hypothetical protein